MKNQLSSAVLIIMLGVLACSKPPEYAPEPRIEFLGFNKELIHQGIQGNPLDTLAISFSFEDGDGDIGSEDAVDVFLTDSRTGFQERFLLPIFEDDAAEVGISGTITLKLPNNIYLCCIYPNTTDACFRNPEYPRDSFSYRIQIMDRAGNVSNTITTDRLTLICD